MLRFIASTSCNSNLYIETYLSPELQSVVKMHLFHFSLYDFLWKDDMQGNYVDFIRHDPGIEAIKREVMRLLKVEQKVIEIPDILPVGSICLHTDPVKNALHGFAMAWKNQYGSKLHNEAKVGDYIWFNMDK